MRIGLNVMTHPGDRDPVAIARDAEARGYESVWMTDGGGRFDAITTASAIGALTTRVRVGISVVPVYTRPAPVLATSAAALTLTAGGRLVFGLGSSSETMIARWYGIPFERPLTRVRETVALLRRILDGERTEFEGETIRSHGFRLTSRPRSPVPIYLAALRPRMLELAGELGDGVVLNLAPAEVVPRLLEHVDAGARRSGRRVEDLEVASLQHAIVATPEEEPEALSIIRRVALGYYSAGVYNRFLAWMGHEREAEAIREGFARRDRKQTEGALSDELVRKLGLVGGPDAIRAHLADYARAGLHTAIIGAASPDEGVWERTIAALAPPELGPVGEGTGSGRTG